MIIMSFELAQKVAGRNNIERHENNLVEFREFFSEQILLPKEEWSDEFKEYVKRKYDELNSESHEYKKEQEVTFKRYLKGFDLSAEDLKDKKVLDIGCGENGEFVKECIDRDITSDIYGLDREIDPKKITGHSSHFRKGLMQKDISIKNTDYTLSAGAMSLFSEKEEIKQVLSKAIDTLNKTGELRIWPLQKVSQESDLVGIKKSRQNWIEVLENLSLEIGIEYKFRPIDIVVSGKDKDVWLEEVLIIKKKK